MSNCRCVTNVAKPGKKLPALRNSNLTFSTFKSCVSTALSQIYLYF